MSLCLGFNSSGCEIRGMEMEIDLGLAGLLADNAKPWIHSTVAALLIGLSGVLPLLIIPIEKTSDLKDGESANFLKILLSFAVGGLMGDVFLHSLPEIFSKSEIRMNQGSLILIGLVLFVVVEKIFSVVNGGEQQPFTPEKINNNIKGYAPNHKTDSGASDNKKKITGYLNLLANAIDNFTHGLQVGGAFLVSARTGCLTTFAILVHEVPHEVGDFAILLKSGFSRWDAAKGQIITAVGGIMGSIVAITFSGAKNSIEARTSWILPFTAGTFLHIALVTVLPDLLKEEDPKESLKQFSALLLGIGTMAVMTAVLE